MKKIIGAIVLTAGLVACGSSSSTTNEKLTVSSHEIDADELEQGTTTTEEPITIPELTPEEKFVAAIAADFSWMVNKLGRVKLVDLGKVICQAIAEGMSFSDYLDLVFKYDIDAAAAGALLRESIWNFCPNEQWFLNAAIDELSRS